MSDPRVMILSMVVATRYEAFWIPGLDELDRDEGLRMGSRWLSSAERQWGGAGVIVMYAKSMIANAPLLARAAQRWNVVSTRSRRPSGGGPVLAIWPPRAKVLELAESLARDTALCVIRGRFDIGGWIRKAGASCLLDGYDDVSEAGDVSPEVANALDGMASFDGHNGFIGAGGKEDAIRTLRRIAASPHAPGPDAIEQHLLSTGETNAKGAARAAEWYKEILSGKRHRDYGGRVIQ